MQKSKRFTAIGILPAVMAAAVMLLCGGCERQLVLKTGGTDRGGDVRSETETERDTADIRQQDTEQDTLSDPPSDPLQTEALICVHVCGAVACPGVVYLTEGSRIIDGIDAAGGFLEEADREWCNQAQILSDGDLLRIYTRQETAQLKESGITPASDCFGIIPSVAANGRGDVFADGNAAAEDSRQVNINTADEALLTTLPGIGAVKAKDIIAYRSRNGSFTDISQIRNVSGIGDQVFARIKDRITVE